MPRVVLLLPTSTYRAPEFLRAARTLGVEVVVASEVLPPTAEAGGLRAVAVPLDDPETAAGILTDLDDRGPIDAVIAVDDRGVLVAATAAARLGLPHNPPDAVARTRDKRAMRDALAAAEIAQPRYAAFTDPDAVPDVGYPCVVKPVSLNGSQGVIRADDAPSARAAAHRAHTISRGDALIVEEYVPGFEIAVEGLLRAGALEVLAVFDKPDPLVGPYFEETIYVTPSRIPPAAAAAVERLTAGAARALGLLEGPVHAEIRLDGERMWVVEVAARSIGGLCARALRFGAGINLEEVILRHALGLATDGLVREAAASGVMMLPIPRAGTLRAVHGRDAARAVPGIVGLDITINPGKAVVPLPEGSRYLGFLFARADTPDDVETALRTAHAALDIVVDANRGNGNEVAGGTAAAAAVPTLE